ncbi:MAG: TolC family protein [Bacteroidales bacterium]|nr:TolC family protein [Bacteroidales bacterium]MCF8336896.1 TolC family protein [Bacteroidales bacterium]
MIKQWTIILASIFLFAAGNAQEQEKWNLKDCIDYAHENNIQVKKQSLDLESKKIDVEQSKLDLLPSVNGNVYGSNQWGKTVDPFTNQFATKSVLQAGFSSQANLTLFDGFQYLNNIKMNKLKHKAAQQAYDKLLEDISIQIANQYLQVLFAKEDLEIARNQLNITQQQVERTQKLVDAGTLAKGDLLNIKAQASNEEAQVIQAENNLDLAYLNLAQLLDLPATKDFTIVKPDISLEDGIKSFESIESIYNYALQHQPQIKNAELNVEVSQKNLDIQKGALSPSLTLSGSINSGYSESTKVPEETTTETLTIGTTEGGETVYSEREKVVNTKTQGFTDQLDENLGRSIRLSLDIPIFNNWRQRNQISQAKLQTEQSKFNLRQEKQDLRKTIESAYTDAKAAKNNYKSALQRVEATKEAFKYAEKKFNVGMLNSVEYNDAKKEYTNARSQLLNAKYQFVFTRTVLDFYLGKPIRIKK